MSRRTRQEITAFHVDFDRLTRLSDQAVYQEMRIAVGINKKKIFRKGLLVDSYRVSRANEAVTIHLYNRNTETARFRFVPIAFG